MQEPVKIIIIGGGTAGWLSAGFLLRQLPLSLGKPVNITLIEASDIPTIGVGEATTPSIRQTLAACGIHEVELLLNCDTTFKHGILFKDWRGSQNGEDAYFHPFGDPIEIQGHSVVRRWSKLPPNMRGNFADLFSVQPEMAVQGRAPKHANDAPYDGALSYAYHLDAGKLAEFLKQKFKEKPDENSSSQKGVCHIIAKVRDIKFKQQDEIKSVVLDNGMEIEGDLFLDCTGFAARLINHDKQNDFMDKTDILFVDKAVTTRIAHNGIEDINGFTTATAKQSGWIWDIVLRTRRGVGHVYSSRFCDDEAAIKTLADHIGRPASELDIRKLNMRIGYHKQQWRGNCVAVGLSSGFLEPLESTGIYLAEMVNWALVEFIPRFLAGANPQAHYNNVIAHHYENIVDFIKLHYCISERNDSDFWRKNTDFDTVPDSLKTKLENWRNDCPSVYDFDRRIQCFSAPNYQFVLYGMGWSGNDDNMFTDDVNLIDKIKIRRERLKQYVLQDTLSNADIYGALANTKIPQSGIEMPAGTPPISSASNYQLR